MQKLSLHIGMPKTGTTSIQRPLAALNKKNPELNLLLKTPLLCFLMGETNRSKDLMKRLKIDDTKKLKEDILSEIKKVQTNHLVLSSEFIFEASIDGDLGEFRKNLSDFQKVEIILYLRHPVNHFHSFISQRVKSGQFRPESIYHVSESYYNYSAICDKISEYFELKVFDYGRVSKNLVEHFSEVVGLKLDSNKFKKRENPSLSQEALELAIRLNELIPKSNDLKRRQIIDDLNTSLAKKSKIVIPDAKIYERLIKIAEKQNDELFDKYLSLELLLK